MNINAMYIKTLFFLLCAFLAVPLAWAQDKPNIVVIMTDNQGYGDLGAYGGVRAETPRTDKLASEGVQFLDFQVEPGCSPTRAAFRTIKKCRIFNGNVWKMASGRKQ